MRNVRDQEKPVMPDQKPDRKEQLAADAIQAGWFAGVAYFAHEITQAVMKAKGAG